MSTQEEIDKREEERLSRALAGKVGGNKRSSIWAPVQVKSQPTVPVNYSGVPVSGGGVDTYSPYASVAQQDNEKLKQEQARLKKWGLDTNNANDQHSETSSTASTPGLHSSQSIENIDDQVRAEERRLTKMGLSSNNLVEDYGVVSRHTPSITPRQQDDAVSVDNTSILGNVDANSSDEKMRIEAKRLERWGLKIGGSSSSPSSAASTPVVSSQPTPSTPSSSSQPAPFTAPHTQAVASQYNLPASTVQPILDKIIYAAKAVKLILHKKSSNHEVTIAVLLDLVQQSASFAVNLTADLPISFDISQNAGKLAGAVNELVKNAQDREPVQTIAIYEEIQSLLGLIYLAVVAN